MIYRLRHVTTYRYASPVTFAQCSMTLTPRSQAGQAVQDEAIALTPKPKARTEHRSFFGHTVTVAEFDSPHTVLRIKASARVSVNRGVMQVDASPAWEIVREGAETWPSLRPDAPVHFLFPSPRIQLADEVTAYARESFASGRPVVRASGDLMRRIRQDFRYDPDATKVSTPLLEAFRQRRGVCQDFAHIMIAGLRGLGVPARYVSGYIRTSPPEGQTRLEGADATHAWVDVWCGAEQGWVGVDPTNAMFVCDDHVVLASGRDYHDVAPVGGILLGAGRQDVEVNVDLIPVDDR